MCYKNIILISVTTTSSTIVLRSPEELVVISSPNYPGNCPNNVEMSVYIFAVGADVVLNILDLELSPSCTDPLETTQSKLYYTVSNMINLELSECEQSYS